MVTLSEFADEFQIERSGGNVGNACIGRRTHVGRAATRLEWRPFADDTAWSDMADNSSVHSDLEDAVENQCQRGGFLVLAKQEVAGAQLSYRRSFVSSHDLLGHCAFQLRLRLGNVGHLVLAAPGRVATEYRASPDLIACER